MRRIALIVTGALLILALHWGFVLAAPPLQEPGCTNYIMNGDFEEEGGWVISKTPRPARYATENFLSGTRSMFLGILSPEEDTFSFSSIQQVVKIPSEIYSVSISFWYFTHFGENAGQDEAKLVLIDPYTRTVIEVPWRTGESTEDWQQETVDLTERLKGKDAIIYFGVFNDGNGTPSYMYLDQVELMVCTSPPPTEVFVPTPTPTETPTPVPPPTETPTPVPFTPTPTETPAETPTVGVSPTFTETPTPLSSSATGTPGPGVAMASEEVTPAPTPLTPVKKTSGGLFSSPLLYISIVIFAVALGGTLLGFALGGGISLPGKKPVQPEEGLTWETGPESEEGSEHEFGYEEE